LLCRTGQGRRMVAGGMGNHTRFFIRHTGYRICGAPYLEGTRALEVFTFEKYLATEQLIDRLTLDNRCMMNKRLDGLRCKLDGIDIR